jgi:hypothetical protein
VGRFLHQGRMTDPADLPKIDPADIAAAWNRPNVDPDDVATVLNRLPGVQGKPKVVMRFARRIAYFPGAFDEAEGNRELFKQLQKIEKRLRKDSEDYLALTRFAGTALRALVVGTPFSQVSDIGWIVHQSLKMHLLLVQHAMAAVRPLRGRPSDPRHAELAAVIAWAFQELTGKPPTVSITRGNESTYVQTCQRVFALFGLSPESAITAAKHWQKFEKNLGE